MRLESMPPLQNVVNDVSLIVESMTHSSIIARVSSIQFSSIRCSPRVLGAKISS